jgi:hypothetical protein
MSISKINVKLGGMAPIMFDRYPGDNKTDLLPEQKLYYDIDGNVVIPAINILSFLGAENTMSAAKRFYDQRKYKRICGAIRSYVDVEPQLIPIMRNGASIKFTKFDENGIKLHKSIARLKGGVPNPKTRPVIELPWEISFDLIYNKNALISLIEINNLFTNGGQTIGLGTYRGVFGKFEVLKWSKI